MAMVRGVDVLSNLRTPPLELDHSTEVDKRAWREEVGGQDGAWREVAVRKPCARPREVRDGLCRSACRNPGRDQAPSGLGVGVW